MENSPPPALGDCTNNDVTRVNNNTTNNTKSCEKRVSICDNQSRHSTTSEASVSSRTSSSSTNATTRSSYRLIHEMLRFHPRMADLKSASLEGDLNHVFAAIGRILYPGKDDWKMIEDAFLATCCDSGAASAASAAENDNNEMLLNDDWKTRMRTGLERVREAYETAAKIKAAFPIKSPDLAEFRFMVNMICTPDLENYTAIHYAATCGHLDLVKSFICLIITSRLIATDTSFKRKLLVANPTYTLNTWLQKTDSIGNHIPLDLESCPLSKSSQDLITNYKFPFMKLVGTITAAHHFAGWVVNMYLCSETVGITQKPEMKSDDNSTSSASAKALNNDTIDNDEKNEKCNNDQIDHQQNKVEDDSDCAEDGDWAVLSESEPQQQQQDGSDNNNKTDNGKEVENEFFLCFEQDNASTTVSLDMSSHASAEDRSHHNDDDDDNNNNGSVEGDNDDEENQHRDIEIKPTTSTASTKDSEDDFLEVSSVCFSHDANNSVTEIDDPSVGQHDDNNNNNDDDDWVENVD